MWGTCGSINLVGGPSSSCSSSSSRCFCPSNAQGQQPFARQLRDGTVPLGRSPEPIDNAIQRPSPWAESDMSSGRMLMDGWTGGMPFDETASFCSRQLSPTPFITEYPSCIKPTNERFKCPSAPSRLPQGQGYFQPLSRFYPTHPFSSATASAVRSMCEPSLTRQISAAIIVMQTPPELH